MQAFNTTTSMGRLTLNMLLSLRSSSAKLRASASTTNIRERPPVLRGQTSLERFQAITWRLRVRSQAGQDGEAEHHHFELEAEATAMHVAESLTWR
jgi:hypothetical protein